MNMHTPPFDPAVSRQRADEMIRRHGRLCCLRRRGMADRIVYAAESQFTASERIGKLLNPNDRLMLVSALASDGTVLDPPPDPEKDQLVSYLPDTFDDDETLKIIMSPERKRQGNVNLYWRVRVRL